MNESAAEGRQRLLDPIDRVSEIIFGLIMAVTIVGSLSVATAGEKEIRTVLAAALGCNLAWGLVDAVMYLVRALTERTRYRALARRIADADPQTAHRIIESALPAPIAPLAGRDELEGMRLRLLAASPAERATLRRDDYLSAFAIFLLVVATTFPVAAPFLLTDNPAVAMRASNAVTLAMLFLAGWVLGRHAGHAKPIRTGFLMSALGAALIAAVIALGG